MSRLNLSELFTLKWLILLCEFHLNLKKWLLHREGDIDISLVLSLQVKRIHVGYGQYRKNVKKKIFKNEMYSLHIRFTFRKLGD